MIKHARISSRNLSHLISSATEIGLAKIQLDHLFRGIKILDWIVYRSLVNPIENVQDNIVRRVYKDAQLFTRTSDWAPP